MPTYICNEDSSNKFWGYETNGNSVTVKWGRLGLKGQEQEKKFKGTYERDSFIDKKVSEKLGGGYKEVTAEELQVQTAIAAIIGVGRKLDLMEFVSEQDGNIKKLTPKELHLPTTKPFVYARIIGRRAANTETAPETELLMDANTAFVVKVRGTRVLEKTPIKAGDDCEDLTVAVGQCVAKVLL